jgi:mannosyltransferase OCH1-like enzyme
MATWKEKLEAYEFMLWDTKRFDVNSVLWVKQAFETELYAPAADYIRLYAVYNYGGIYLDMDMEVVKPFDGLLLQELMLAYENNINENVEAGCFGAEKGHPYIKKCMEYMENTPLFEQNLLAKILDIPRSERHWFINPLILPEIMKNAAKDFFCGAEFKFYPRDYFTAKNVLTGEIETTENTFTIHNFSALYHSEKWRKIRDKERKIRVLFGEKTLLSKILICCYRAARRIKKFGPLSAARYCIDRFILRKKAAESFE